MPCLLLGMLTATGGLLFFLAPSQLANPTRGPRGRRRRRPGAAAPASHAPRAGHGPGAARAPPSVPPQLGPRTQLPLGLTPARRKDTREERVRARTCEPAPTRAPRPARAHVPRTGSRRGCLLSHLPNTHSTSTPPTRAPPPGPAPLAPPSPATAPALPRSRRARRRGARRTAHAPARPSPAQPRPNNSWVQPLYMPLLPRRHFPALLFRNTLPRHTRRRRRAPHGQPVA
jgi:hypothetical protein